MNSGKNFKARFGEVKMGKKSRQTRYLESIFFFVIFALKGIGSKNSDSLKKCKQVFFANNNTNTDLTNLMLY